MFRYVKPFKHRMMLKVFDVVTVYPLEGSKSATPICSCGWEWIDGDYYFMGDVEYSWWIHANPLGLYSSKSYLTWIDKNIEDTVNEELIKKYDQTWDMQEVFIYVPTVPVCT